MTEARLRWIAWLLIGILAAIAADYMLYRMSLPVSPFIYQAF
jgi:hypothetical protein